MLDFLKAVLNWIVEQLLKLLKIFDPDKPNVVEWAVCIHPNRAKVFKAAHNESKVIGHAFPREEYAIANVHVIAEGKEFGFADLRPWHPSKFTGHDFGYIWLDDPKERWRLEFRV